MATLAKAVYAPSDGRTAMSTLSLSIPDSLRAFVDAQVAAGNHRSARDYIQKLLRDAMRREAERVLDAMLLEGVRAPKRRMTAKDWKALEDQVLRRRGRRDAHATGRHRE